MLNKKPSWKPKHPPVEYAIRSLTSKPQTEAQIREKLEKYFPDINYNAVINRLEELNYINDEAFVDRWLRYRANGSPKGTFQLRRELKQKGVDPALIESKLSTVDEESMVRALIEKKWPTVKGKDLYHRKQKLAQFLASRGFNSSVVWDSIGQLEE
jgi:regulatory protein